MKQPTPREIFDESIADANRLLALAVALTNKRTYRLRRELREALEPALSKLGIPKAERDGIDGIESDDLFVLLLPAAALSRDDFRDHSTLLRGALIAGCSAFETFLCGWAVARMRRVNKMEGLSERAQKIPMTIANWTEVQSSKYPARAITDRVIKPHLEELASTAANKVGQVLSTVGIDKPLQRLDEARKTTKGSTQEQLDEITGRRNKIAHAADREGRRKATMTVAQTSIYLEQLQDIAGAIEGL